MKNICFLIGNLNHAGGTERVTSLIANGFAERSYNISILSLVGGDNPFFNLNDNIENQFLYSKSVSFKKRILQAIYRIRQFVKKQKIDTLVVVDSISCIFTVPALVGLKGYIFSDSYCYLEISKDHNCLDYFAVPFATD